jgi:hypothetical protein
MGAALCLPRQAAPGQSNPRKLRHRERVHLVSGGLEPFAETTCW